MSSDSSCPSPIRQSPEEQSIEEALKTAMDSLYHKAYENLKAQTEVAVNSALDSISSSVITPLADQQQTFQQITDQRLLKAFYLV